jgi:hypothetical protein
MKGTMKYLALSIFGLLLGQRLDAQVPSSLQGTWRACFELMTPTPDAPRQVCGLVTLPSGAACGEPIVRWSAPIDSLRAPLRYNGGDVGLKLSAQDISFGGRVRELPPANGGGARCQLSGDDGSLYGQGAFDGSTIVGTWGITGFAAGEPLGRFTLTRP